MLDELVEMLDEELVVELTVELVLTVVVTEFVVLVISFGSNIVSDNKKSVVS